MIPSSRPADEPQPPLARDLLHLARYYVGGRRGLLILAGVALVAGLTLNWGWLTAVGVAPILISLLPCAAMCALGLCMSRTGGKACSTGASTRGSGAAADKAAPDGGTMAFDPAATEPLDQIPNGAAMASLADARPQPLEERNTTDA